MVDTKNMVEYLRGSRSGKKYTISDVMHKIWLCKAIDRSAILYLPRILVDKIITINECGIDGELVPNGIWKTTKLTKNGQACIGIKALGKRFKITSVSSRDSAGDIEISGQHRKGVPKDGRVAEESSPDREGL